MAGDRAIPCHIHSVVREEPTGFTGLEEEFADLLIRLGDCAAAMGLRLGKAWVAKMQFNLTRQDHSAEARLAPGGKSF